MPTELKLSFPATTSGLIAVLEAISHIGITWNLDSDLVSRARIIVEELFSNTIKYGYGQECDRPIRIHLHADLGLSLIYEDDAAPFDPTRWKPEPGRDIAAGDRNEGQTGIMLIMGLSATARYLPLPDGNGLAITFASEAKAL
jgi:anti-sigma regulatory factor (Ser/Thr protein kinase)